MLGPSIGQAQDVTDFQSIRSLFNSSAGNVGHECSRFALVIASSPLPSGKDVRSCCNSVLQAVQSLVSCLQLITHTSDENGLLDDSLVKSCLGLRQKTVSSNDDDSTTSIKTMRAATFVSTFRKYIRSFLTAIRDCLVSGNKYYSFLVTSRNTSTQEASKLKQKLMFTVGLVIDIGWLSMFFS